MSTKPTVVFVTLILALANLTLAGSKAPSVPFPEGFRNWTHVKSMVLQEGHPLYESFGGIHHVYANSTALQALTKGTSFPDGSIFVFDLYEAVADNGALGEGKHKVIGVMHKDSKLYGETGGWGFEGFEPESHERVVTDAKAQCFFCHMSVKDHDYVFSRYRQ